MIDRLFLSILGHGQNVSSATFSGTLVVKECGMYPVFEVNQKVFPSKNNDWDAINKELWVCVC